MFKVLAVVLTAFVLCIPRVGVAAPAEPGAYVSGFLGVSIPRDTQVTGTDFVTDFDFDDNAELDPGVYLGGSGGYDFGFFRLEGELSYRYTEFDSITDQNSARIRNVDGSLGVLAMMFNGFFDLHNDSPITPYLGGGIGFASMHLSNTWGRDNSGRVLLYGTDDDTVFAYQGGAGIDIAFNRRLSMDVGYRYFATDDADFDSHRDIASNLDFRSHNAAVAIRVKF